MKIIKLTAENIMKLSAVEIIPADNLILVTGKNGAGKSSVLDSIVMALGGKETLPEQPVKKGKDKGKIVLDLGEFKVTRSFTKDNSYLKIESAAGAEIKSPQKFLDKLIGKISFDPLDFINHKQAEQREIYLGLIGVDINQFAKKEESLRSDRQVVGGTLKRAEAELSGITFYPNIKETEELKVDDLSLSLSEAFKFNREWDDEFSKNEEKKNLAGLKRERISDISEEIVSLQKEAERLETEITELKESYRARKSELLKSPKIDSDYIQSQISNASETNSKIRSNKRHNDLASNIIALKDEYQGFTDAINKIAEEKDQLLASSPIPVPGLSIDDNGVLYKGIPLSQCSDGEKLMVSLSISMALNPTIRVLRIKDGSLLDEHNRRIIYDRIKDKDFQLWMESVSSDKSVGIFIEEGNIVAIDGQEVAVKKQKDPKPEQVPPKIDNSTDNTPVDEPKTSPAVPEDW